jgi:hypothetical protein
VTIRTNALHTPLSRLFLFLALATAATGLAIYATGGGRFEIAGIPISLRSPGRALLAASLFFFFFTRLAPGSWRASLADVVSPQATAAAAAIAIAIVGLVWGSKVAGGADAVGYVGQAGLWRAGQLTIERPIVADSPWPHASDTWAPLGFTTRPHDTDLVPVYPPGLPLLMALAQSVVGFCGAFLIAPLTGGLTVWLTYALGRRLLDRRGVALAGALLVATSPAFLFQLMNPMSDVPVTAAWTLALLLTLDRRPGLAGLAAAVAIAIRPNLAPLALAPLAWTAIDDRLGALRFAAAMSPGVAGVALFNAHLYGSPLLSGYGPAGPLYSAGHVPVNARLYLGWLTDVETPAIALATLFFVRPSFVGPTAVRHPRFLLGTMLAIVAASYLVYLPFDSWTYLRFLLPVWPVLMLLTAGVLGGLLRRVASKAYPVAFAAIVVTIALQTLATATGLGVFVHAQRDNRYVDVARFVGQITDRQAVMISMQHSGSLYLYAGRMTLRYERLDRRWLDPAVDHLRASGRHPYIVLDRAELEDFSSRFAGASRLASLNWSPVAVLRDETYVFDAVTPESHAQPAAIPSTTELLRCHEPLIP